MNNQVTDQQIDEYLRLFDGDPIAAVHAVRDRMRRQRAVETKKTAVKPRGDVLLSVTDMEKSYRIGRQKVHALRGVSLDVHAGEFLAITGASGSGKSTLLQMIGGLDKPTAGRVVIDGKDLSKLNDVQLSNFRQTMIGFVFQSFYLQPFLRLDDNIAVPAMFSRATPKQIDASVTEALRQVGLQDFRNHLPKELSGGQIQRAAIARALINNPRIILADEPTGNLDLKNSQAIIELFQTIQRDLGTTIIIVTHNPEVAARADRVITLSDGVIV